MDGPPGPSIDIRSTHGAVEGLLSPHGFTKRGIIEVRPYNYLITFSR